MADQPRKDGLFRELLGLGRSLVNLRRAFRGEGPVPGSEDGPGAEPAQGPALPLALQAPPPNFEDAQLLTQHTPGWRVPQLSRLPVPTYAPPMTAFGIVFIALGAVTMWPLSVIGALIFVSAITKWIGELLHD